MKRSLRILFVSTEMVPFAKTGGLADVSCSLPKSLAKLGHDVKVVLPLYGCVLEDRWPLALFKRNIRHPLTGRLFGFSVFGARESGLSVYFIRNDRYFKRPGIYGTGGVDYADNAERFGFLSRAALVLAGNMNDFLPDVIHCNDWQTALIPLFMKHVLKNSLLRNTKTLLTVHNLAYQGVFGRDMIRRIGLPASSHLLNNLDFYGRINFLKAGLLLADALSTVSRRYAEEILTEEYGCGLESILRKRKNDLVGIPNGVDYDEWNPANDRFLKVKYGPDSVEKKVVCKKDLLDRVKLDVPVEWPVVGYVGRLVYQKGVDLVENIAEKLAGEGAVLVVQGQGDALHEKLFRDAAEKFPGSVRFFNEFNDELAHKIEAGCDIFLMPSRYEPCGLNQMYSMKYGSVPIVRATGGLDDAVTDFGSDSEKGNGFKFSFAAPDELFGAVKKALNVYKNKNEWRKLMLNGMSRDFSWERSAAEYEKLYYKMTGEI